MLSKTLTILRWSFRFAGIVSFMLMLEATLFLRGCGGGNGGPPTPNIGATAAFVGTNRIGYNTGNSDNFFGANAITANYFDNPGFEPPSVSHLIIVGSGATGGGTTGSFTDTSDNGGLGVTSWVGATASVRNGASAGLQFTITSYSAGSYTFGTCENAAGGIASCPTLEQGAAVAETLVSPTVLGGMGGPAKGQLGAWTTNDAGCGYTIAAAFDGKGSAVCDVSNGGTHAIQYYWDFGGPTNGGVCSNDNVTPCTAANQATDCASGAVCLTAPQAGPAHPVVGPFELAFYAMAQNTAVGAPQVNVQLTRFGGGTSVNQTVALTNDGAWHQYVIPFTGTDKGWSGAQNQQEMILTLTESNGVAEAGANIYLDDAYLGKQAASSTGFRQEFITTNNALNPGSIRYMGGGSTMSANRATLEGAAGCIIGQGSGPDAPGTCDYQHGASVGVNGVSGDHILSGSQWSYASANLYPVANTNASAPWFQISNMFSDADLKTFADNACAALTTYSNIPAIYIEQSNEEWNIGSPSFSVRYGSSDLGTGPLSYGGQTGRNFSIMSAEAAAKCPSLAPKFHYLINGITCNGSTFGAAIQAAANAGFPIPNTSQYGVDGALYYNISFPAASGDLITQAASYASLFFQAVPPLVGPEGTGCMNGLNGTGGSDWAFMGSNNFEGMYETGPNAYGGNVEQQYLSEAGFPSAAWMASSWLLAQQGQNQNGSGPLGRVPVQNEYQLVQQEFLGAPIWGFAHDMDSDFGPAFPHLRPIGLAMEVVNAAIPTGGEFHIVGGSGFPTPSVMANAYYNPATGKWSTIVINKTNMNQSFNLVYPSGATAPANYSEVVSTNSIADNSENSNDVKFQSGIANGSPTNGIPANCSGQICSMFMPPLSIVSVE